MESSLTIYGPSCSQCLRRPKAQVYTIKYRAGAYIYICLYTHYKFGDYSLFSLRLVGVTCDSFGKIRQGSFLRRPTVQSISSSARVHVSLAGGNSDLSQQSCKRFPSFN